MALVDISRNVRPWNQYIKPTQRIHSSASAVNKLTVRNNKLCYNGVECSNVVSAEEASENFYHYLNENFPEGVVLVAHNGARFDFPLLKRDLMSYQKCRNKNYNIMCIDSIKVFKTQFPGLDAYNQPYLIERFLGSENVSSAHEAVGDCLNLRNALEMAAKEKNISLEDFLDIPGKPLIDDEVPKKKSRKNSQDKKRKGNISERSISQLHITKKLKNRKYNLRRRNLH